MFITLLKKETETSDREDWFLDNFRDFESLWELNSRQVKAMGKGFLSNPLAGKEEIKAFLTRPENCKKLMQVKAYLWENNHELLLAIYSDIYKSPVTGSKV